MREAPEPVLLYIPLMKELNLSWEEIKTTPRVELEGLLIAFQEYNSLHSFDGYDEKDINEMAKKKPELRSRYVQYLEKKRKYYNNVSKPSFKDLL
tara:strand:+ start:5099 stop:5383 length:285 start_codon:yes stop_codon:yes gene_type:complete